MSARAHRDAQLAEAQELAGLGTFELDPSTGAVRCSQELYRIYGVRPREVEPSWETFMERVHPDDAPRVRDDVNRVLREHRPVSTLHCIVRWDGEIRELHTRMKVTASDGSSGAPRVIGMSQDVTEQRHEAEERLEARERFRLAFEEAPIGMALVGLDGRWLQVNQALCELTGYSEERLLARSYQDIVHPDDLEGAVARGEGLLRGDLSSYQVETRYLHSDGRTVQVKVTAALARHLDGRPRYFIAHIEDITERSETKVALRESRELLQGIFDNTEACLYLKDLDGRYLLANTASAEAVGRAPEEVVGATDFELWPESIAEQFASGDRSVIESGAPLQFEQCVLRDGEPHTYITQKFLLRDGEGRPYATGGISTDITERVRVEEENRRLEAELHQRRRLDMVGRLAGGIAHDFNNLMSVIINYAALLQQDMPGPSEPAEEILEIRRAAEQATALTQRLVAFSRGEVIEPEVIHASALVDEAERLLRVSIGEDVELAIERPTDPWAVEVDVDQLQSVLLNLALNARDAMPGGGSLSIATENVLLDAEEAARFPEAIEPGRYVCLSVTDTGCGMEEEVAARAFEPFFTTKAPSEAGGLGLAMVYGVVRQSGGRVELDSRPGAGTTVRVYLPATDRKPTRQPRDFAGAAMQGNGETILVVEDEESVRGLVSRVLSRNGYWVLEAREPEEALRRFADGPAEIDLLLSDVVLPGMSGPALASRLAAAQPDVRVVLMSGYTDDVVIGLDDDRVPLLKKPFTLTRLLTVVSHALSPEPPSDATPPERRAASP